MRSALHNGTRCFGVLGWSQADRRLLSTVAAVLESRAVFEISGGDAKTFLQGLITNDMSLLDEGEGQRPCISAAFLNPKGRVLGDGLLTRSPRHEAKRKPGYLLDCPPSVAPALKTHLKLFKLRSKVKIKDATTVYDVLVSGVQDPWQPDDNGEGDDVPPTSDVGAGGRTARFTDPRCTALGVRLIRPKGEEGSKGADWPHGDPVVSEERYHALRMANGVGEGSELVESIPLESNLDLLGSISFTKGCYVGQELTARTQFKGFVRKRVMPVLFPAGRGNAPASPIRGVPNVVGDLERTQELSLREWGSATADSARGRPEAGSKVVDRAGGDEKLGALVAVSPGYNVGLALLRLGKIMTTASVGSEDGNALHPRVDCHIVHGSGQEEGGEEEARRCLPLTPPWWPTDLDPTTGKVPS